MSHDPSGLNGLVVGKCLSAAGGLSSCLALRTPQTTPARLSDIDISDDGGLSLYSDSFSGSLFESNDVSIEPVSVPSRSSRRRRIDEILPNASRVAGGGRLDPMMERDYQPYNDLALSYPPRGRLAPMSKRYTSGIDKLTWGKHSEYPLSSSMPKRGAIGYDDERNVDFPSDMRMHEQYKFYKQRQAEAADASSKYKMTRRRYNEDLRMSHQSVGFNSLSFDQHHKLGELAREASLKAKSYVPCYQG